MPLPTALYFAEQVRALDRIAMEERGMGGGQLMARAGLSAFQVLRTRWPRARCVHVWCGPGNNGGDGYVLARWLREAGLTAQVWALEDPQPLSGDARAAWQAYRDHGGTVQPFATGQLVVEADVVVDALFGTGLERDVEGSWRQAIREINGCGKPVLSLDVPSGLHADSGRILGEAVRATATVSFIGLKAGLFTAHGPDVSGELIFDDLGVPADLYSEVASAAERLTQAAVAALLPPRLRDSHKGVYGHVLVVGGNHGMAGAARLAGEAGGRCGAGLISVATRSAHIAAVAGARPELMAYGVVEAAELIPLLRRASVLALGPGLGQDAWAQSLLSAAWEVDLPCVVDADGLNLLAREPGRRNNWVLTPHPGEAARLLQTSTAEVQADRFGAAQAIARGYGGVCVLKGAGTLVAAEGQDRIGLCDGGNPGMASGGMGDVLTGVIAALLAQGLSPFQAASLGVWLHARAADSAARAGGERGLLASDLMPWLRHHLNGTLPAA